MLKRVKYQKLVLLKQEEWVRNLISLYQDQMSYGAEIVELSQLFFKEELEYEEGAKEVLAEEQVPEVLQAFPSGNRCFRELYSGGN